MASLISILAALGRMLNWIKDWRLVALGRRLERADQSQTQIRRIREAEKAALGADIDHDSDPTADDGFRRD